MNNKKHWYDYLWIVSVLYLILGFVNILFAWIGLLCFFIPLLFAIIGGNKLYCNRYCGRSQLFDILGKKFKLSPDKPVPHWLRSRKFRYGFLAFFMAMFFNMLYITWLVYGGAASLNQAVTLLWTWQMPWHWAYSGGVPDWAAQFAFGFYSVMLTSTILGIITLLFFKPRAWCVYCPMGTMTQIICKWKNKE